MSIDIHDALDKAPLLVGGDQQRHPGLLLHMRDIGSRLIEGVHLGTIDDYSTRVQIVNHRLQVI